MQNKVSCGAEPYSLLFCSRNEKQYIPHQQKQKQVAPPTLLLATMTSKEILLFDTNSLAKKPAVGGDDFVQGQILNHCKALYGKRPSSSNGRTDYNGDEWTRAQTLLKETRVTIMNKCIEKIRCQFLARFREKGIQLGSFNEVVAQMQGERVTLELCVQVFRACFTWVHDTKTTLLATVASEVIHENNIRFLCPCTEEERLSCIVPLVEEAIHTARKPFMKSGNNSRNVVSLGTKKRLDADWDGVRQRPPVPSHFFSFEKLHGWKRLSKFDPIAKEIFESRHELPCRPEKWTDATRNWLKSSGISLPGLGVSTDSSPPAPSFLKTSSSGNSPTDVTAKTSPLGMSSSSWSGSSPAEVTNEMHQNPPAALPPMDSSMLSAVGGPGLLGGKFVTSTLSNYGLVQRQSQDRNSNGLLSEVLLTDNGPAPNTSDVSCFTEVKI